MDMADRLAACASTLRGQGAIRTAAVEHAFRTARRDRCVTHFHPSSGSRTDVDPKEPPEAVSDVIVACGDAGRGVPSRAPFDRVVVTFPGDRLSPAWLDQLGEGGLPLVPLRLAGAHSTPTARINRADAFGTAVQWTSPRDYDWSVAVEEFTRPEYPIPIPARR